MKLLEQWLAVIVAFGVKPVYMLLSLGLIIWLWRFRAADLFALRWGMIFFLVGEAFCAINYLFCAKESHLIEFLHSYGMAVCFSFTVYALLEGMDYRLIKFSSPQERCAALSLCRACFKNADVPCGLKRLFMVITPALIVMTCMMLCSRIEVVVYNTIILGAVYQYSHPVIYQLFEVRYCPLLAVALLMASWLVLIFKRVNPVPPAKVLFAAGVGPMGFGFLRLILFSAYDKNLMWFTVWEEITELLFIVGTVLVLWFFKHGLIASVERTKL
jgi:hypothetical protein